jgi:hypothetical protein
MFNKPASGLSHRGYFFQTLKLDLSKNFKMQQINSLIRLSRPLGWKDFLKIQILIKLNYLPGLHLNLPAMFKVLKQKISQFQHFWWYYLI